MRPNELLLQQSRIRGVPCLDNVTFEIYCKIRRAAALIYTGCLFLFTSPSREYYWCRVHAEVSRGESDNRNPVESFWAMLLMRLLYTFPMKNECCSTTIRHPVCNFVHLVHRRATNRSVSKFFPNVYFCRLQKKRNYSSCQVCLHYFVLRFSAYCRRRGALKNYFTYFFFHYLSSVVPFVDSELEFWL